MVIYNPNTGTSDSVRTNDGANHNPSGAYGGNSVFMDIFHHQENLSPFIGQQIRSFKNADYKQYKDGIVLTDNIKKSDGAYIQKEKEVITAGLSIKNGTTWILQSD